MAGINWTELHESRRFTFFTVPLALMSLVYGLGVRLDRLISGMKKKRYLPGFVLSVGNLTTGGTGKTPAVRMLARWAMKQGYRPAIISRGYGGNYDSRIFVVSDGREIKAGPDRTGDEPYLLARVLKGVPVVVSRDRFSAGMEAYSRFRTNFFILDDGFQHVRLKRDMDIVLMDKASPFGNGHLLPWGPLREPVKNVKRAHAVIYTRSDNSRPKEMLNGALNSIEQFSGNHIPERLVLPFEQRESAPGDLKGRKITAFAGIAKPSSFRETLLKLGAEILSFRMFRDHHCFNLSEIEEIKREKERLGADYIITTEKDWVRLGAESADIPGLGYVTITFAVTSEPDSFFEMIKKRADKRLNSSI